MKKRWSLIIIFIFLFLFIDLPVGKTGNSFAIERGSKNRDKNFNNAIHIVRKGDTLYRIARLNGLTVNELRNINGLKGNRIRIGQSLILRTQRNPGQEGEEIEEIKDAEKNESSFLPVPVSRAGWGQTGKSEGIEDYSYGEVNKGIIGEVLSYAGDLLGVPYRFGGTTSRAIDCSAFVQKVFRSIGIDLPRTAREQFKRGMEVDRDHISEGDLIFFKTYSRYPSHVGIYIGDNQFIHASRKDRRVRIDSLKETYYKKRFLGARRLIQVIVEPVNPDLPHGS